MGECCDLCLTLHLLTVCSFGAVLEDFELRDSLENVFAQKDAIPGLAETRLDDAKTTQQAAAF
jgi:hypothetical protein